MINVQSTVHKSNTNYTAMPIISKLRRKSKKHSKRIRQYLLSKGRKISLRKRLDRKLVKREERNICDSKHKIYRLSYEEKDKKLLKNDPSENRGSFLVPKVFDHEDESKTKSNRYENKQAISQVNHYKKEQILIDENISQYQASLTGSTEIKSNMYENKQAISLVNHYRKDQILTDENISQYQASLTGSTEASSWESELKTKSNVCNDETVTLPTFDNSNTRQDLKIVLIEDMIQDLENRAPSIQHQVKSGEQSHNISDCTGVLPCDNVKRIAKQAEFYSNKEKFTYNRVEEDQVILAFKTSPPTKTQQAACMGTLSLAESYRENTIDRNYLIEENSLINIATFFHEDKNQSHYEESRIGSTKVTSQEDELKTVSKLYSEIDTCNMEYSFEIVLDAVSLVESDLDEEYSVDENSTEENVLVASIFSFDAVNILKNGPQATLGVPSYRIFGIFSSVSVDEYFHSDVKLSIVLALLLSCEICYILYYY